jgi:hypothetical protein
MELPIQSECQNILKNYFLRMLNNNLNLLEKIQPLNNFHLLIVKKLMGYAIIRFEVVRYPIGLS